MRKAYGYNQPQRRQYLGTTNTPQPAKLPSKSQLWKEYYIYNFENTALSAGTGTVFVDSDIKLDLDADYELVKRSHVADDNRIMVSFKDDATGRNYNNIPLDIRTISGAPVGDITLPPAIDQIGFQPYVLPLPVIYRAASNITAGFADYRNSGDNSIRMALHGSKLRCGLAPWNRQWKSRLYFDYALSVSIDASQTLATSISTNIDSHFMVKKITGIYDHDFLITVKDGATDRQWMDKATHCRNFIGSARLPNVLPAPRFVYRGSVIYVTMQNLTSSTVTIKIVFSGEKLFE